MCIAALAWDAHPDWLMVVAGNRDEFHARPSAPLAQWHDGSGIIAGRDLQAGGTWLGIAEQPRFALVTNFRAPGYPMPDMASRGALVTDVLTGQEPEAPSHYNPYNLMVATHQGAWMWGNYPTAFRLPLPPGIHGLSNGDFAQPWPKTRQLTAALGRWLAGGAADTAMLFDALADSSEPKGQTGSDGPEPPYTPVFIRNPIYGTRCSTVIVIARDGQGLIAERRFEANGQPSGDTAIAFHWQLGQA